MTKSKLLREEIMKRMEAKNFSISALERRAGVSMHAVRNILKGRIKNPSVQSLQAIASALECSIQDLMYPSRSITLSLNTLEIKTKEFLSLEDFVLMINCFKSLTELIGEKNLVISIDDYLKIIAIAYSYSLYDEPKVLDLKFLKWILDKKKAKILTS